MQDSIVRDTLDVVERGGVDWGTFALIAVVLLVVVGGFMLLRRRKDGAIHS